MKAEHWDVKTEQEQVELLVVLLGPQWENWKVDQMENETAEHWGVKLAALKVERMASCSAEMKGDELVGKRAALTAYRLADWKAVMMVVETVEHSESLRVGQLVALTAEWLAAY